MYHDKQHIFDLPEICFRHNLTEVIIASGSRNAPLTNEFVNHCNIKTYSIVDERSAAFYALGMAQSIKKPVGVLCSSGSAILNFAPAIAEAYYQQIPLVVFTADRPVEWIDQNDNQTLRQKNIYSNYIKKSVNLPQEIYTWDDLWYAHRLISESILSAMTNAKGPVHINIPLKEPLYHLEGTPSAEIKIINRVSNKANFDNNDLKNELLNYKKIMITCGQGRANEELNSALQILAKKKILVLAENICNISGINILLNPDSLLAGINKTEKDNYLPDLIITYGGQVISKRIKKLLRESEIEHWHISPEKAIVDTYQNQTKIIGCKPVAFFEFMKNENLNQDPEFFDRWQTLNEYVIKKRDLYLSEIGFSDLFVFNTIFKHIPEKSVVQLGNSTPVRYTEMVGKEHILEYYSNRGVSGIDGCVSTAAGFAMQTKKPVTLIIGDLSFVYDSNGLWNKTLPKNLKIIVINNEGGAIFRLINDAEKVNFLVEYQETNNPVNIQKLAEAFGVKYDFCQSGNVLNSKLQDLYASAEAMILEIKTPKEKNAGVFRNYYKFLSA